MLVIGLVGALAATLVALSAVAAAVAAQQRAVTAADLAALAGAQRLIDGGTLDQACGESDLVATRNGAALAHCGRAPPGRLTVDCTVAVDLPILGRRAASATAVAGPP